MKKKKVKPGGICKLCGTETKQFRKSHILPEWMVRERTTKGDFYLISSDDTFKRQYPIGIYDFFLCSHCEDGSKKYDDYAATFFRSANEWKTETPHGFTFRIADNFDYPKLKLFMMNILFRSASTSHPFFETARVEKEDLEDLRMMVFNHLAGEAQDFSFIVYKRQKLLRGIERIWDMPRPYLDKQGNRWIRFDLNEFPCDIKTNRLPSKHLESIVAKSGSPLLIREGHNTPERIRGLQQLVIERTERERKFRKDQSERKQ